MSTKSILKADWKRYLDDYSKHIQSEIVELDVESLELGDQIEADWVALKGMSYDPKDDILYIFTDALRHFIAAPQNMWVASDGGKIKSIQIEDIDGTKHLVNVRDAASVRRHAESRPDHDASV